MPRVKFLIFLLWILALLMAGWVFSRLPLDVILVTIGELATSQWLAWITINVLVIGFFTWRWLLLTNMLSIPSGFWCLLQIRQAGQVVSFLTPGPQFGGEPLQVYWLWKRIGLPAHSALVSLGLDRFFELWVNFSVLFLGILLLATTSAIHLSDWQGVLPALGLLLLAVSVFGWVMLAHPQWLVSSLQKMTTRWRHHPLLQRADTHWQALGTDLRRAAGEQRFTLLTALILSLAGWLSMLGELWLMLDMLDVTVEFSTFLVILVAIRLAFLLPLPGGIGTLEAAVYWSFQSLDLPSSAALGLIALMRLRDAIILLAGLGCLHGLKKEHLRP